jgi:D-alanyl-D-alanine carboxypeptidase/D-alanyl-D-alanine-endopeptidase (penicillin-binding protein 4)
LEKALKNLNISIKEKTTTTRLQKENNKTINTNRKTIYIHYSPTLDKIVYWTNLKSINLYAEHLLKYIAYKKNGIGLEVEGTELITNYWKNKGVDVNGFYMNDGCGLARANAITTKTEAQVLNQMVKEKSFKALYESLPIAGKTGSLESMCKGTIAENNLRAKSGYITRARGYTGYVKNKKGELLCFSVIANNYSCSPGVMKKKLERILIAIAEME